MSSDDRPLKLSIKWNNGKGFVNLSELRVGYIHYDSTGTLTDNAQEMVYSRANSAHGAYFVDSRTGLSTTFEIPNEIQSIGTYHFYLRYKSVLVCPPTGPCQPKPILMDANGDEVFIQVDVNEDNISTDISTIAAVNLTSTFTENVVQGLSGEQYTYIMTHDVTGDNVIDSLFQTGSGRTVVFLSTNNGSGAQSDGFKIKIKDPESPNEQYYLSAPNGVLDVTENYSEAIVFWKLNVKTTVASTEDFIYIATDNQLRFSNTSASMQIATKALHYDDDGLVLRTMSTYEDDLLNESKKITPVLQ